ncbi:MAG: hypothetical protein J6Y49_01885 [Alphaproteobacteria bacterium]|nr:hypothetical protein [Alphaproteobacteria bacterium]
MEEFAMLLVCIFFVVTIIQLINAAEEDRQERLKQEKERLKQEEERKRIEMSPEYQFNNFMESHPKLKDKTTINRLKTFIKQRYAIHKIIKELYRLYLLDCDAVGKTPLSYRKWKFAYGL